MIVLKLIMVIILLSMPVCVGAFCNRKNLIDMYVYGQLMMWAVFQILAVPMIHLRLPFLALVIVFMLAMLVLCVIFMKKYDISIKNAAELKQYLQGGVFAIAGVMIGFSVVKSFALVFPPAILFALSGIVFENYFFAVAVNLVATALSLILPSPVS